MSKRKVSSTSVGIDGLEKEDQPKGQQLPKEDAMDLIKRLNAMSPADFRTKHLSPDLLKTLCGVRSDVLISVSFYPAATLPKETLATCLDLIHLTSGQHYTASGWGWHINRKRREMKEVDMRYIILHADPLPIGSADSTLTLISPIGDSSHIFKGSGTDGHGFAGFLSFMLTHDSIPSTPVLYVYEIHLTEAMRGCGCGRDLMRLAEQLAERVGVDKVMLTCFVSNQKALAFYQSLGYRPDVCSPADRKLRNKTMKADYVIMSKDVKHQKPSLEASDEVWYTH